MKASVYNQYGSPEALQLVDVPKPTPWDRDASVKVHATIGDTIMRGFKSPNITGWEKFMARLIRGWHKPRHHILGMELARGLNPSGGK